MTTATKILFDELIEQGHHERTEDVIFWALEYYAENHGDSNGTMISNAIVQRIKDAEKAEQEGKDYVLQNPGIINSITE